MAVPRKVYRWAYYVRTVDSARNLLIQGRQKGLNGQMVDKLDTRLALLEVNEARRIENIIPLSSTQLGDNQLKAIENKSVLELHAAGMLHYKQRDFLKAEELFHKGLKLKPDWAELYKDIGNNYLSQKKYDEAIASYQKAIAIDSTYIAPVKNLGAVEYLLGNIKKAIYYFQQGYNMDPKCNGTLYNLGISYYLNGEQAAATACLNKIIEQDLDRWVVDSAAYLAVLHYLNNDSQSSEKLIKNFSRKTSNENTKLDSYFNFLDLLISSQVSKNQSNKDNFLYVIGESHALVPHGLSISYGGAEKYCTSKWIVGCKQWHLANDQSNKYKYKFEFELANLPSKSNILVTIGEIDCRINEGVIPFIKQHPKINLEYTIRSTVTNFLAYVELQSKKYSHQIIISGIPAPNINFSKVNAQDTILLIKTVDQFNITLTDKCKEFGFDFLDVYSLTNRGDGISNNKWHIDDFHLKPSAIQVLFDNHHIKFSKSSNL